MSIFAGYPRSGVMWAHAEKHQFEQTAARSHSLVNWTSTCRSEHVQTRSDVQVSVIAFQTKALAANIKESIRSRRPPHWICAMTSNGTLIPIDSMQNFTKIQSAQEAPQNQNVQRLWRETVWRKDSWIIFNPEATLDSWKVQISDTTLTCHAEAKVSYF